MQAPRHAEKAGPLGRTLTRVTARGLVKTYGSTPVLRGVGFDLAAGTVSVLTGHNGAGKSTLLSILSGQKRPTRGEVRYSARDGSSLDPRVARSRIGWVSHQPLAYLELSAAENLGLVARLHGASPDAVERVIERLGMSSFAHKPVSSLSRGQTQRVALGRALVHGPDFLLLDEPWTGLDQNGSRFLEELLQEEAASGSIIFIVSHQRDVIDKLAASELELRGGLLKQVGAEGKAPKAVEDVGSAPGDP